MSNDHEVMVAAARLTEAMLAASEQLSSEQYDGAQKGAIAYARRFGVGDNSTDDNGILTAVGMNRAASYLRWRVKNQYVPCMACGGPEPCRCWV